MAVLASFVAWSGNERCLHGGNGDERHRDALVAETLARNPELKFYEAEISAAKGGRKTDGLLANPELSGGVGQKTVRGGGVSAEGVAWSVSVLQPFEWPGRLGLRKAIANRDIELAELGYQRFKIALAGRVRTLAYGLFAARRRRRQLEVAESRSSVAEVLVQRSRRADADARNASRRTAPCSAKRACPPRCKRRCWN